MRGAAGAAGAACWGAAVSTGARGWGGRCTGLGGGGFFSGGFGGSGGFASTGNSGGGKSGGGGSSAVASSGLGNSGGGGSSSGMSGGAGSAAGTIRTSIGAISPTTSFTGSTWVKAQPPPTWKKITKARRPRRVQGDSGSRDGPGWPPGRVGIEGAGVVTSSPRTEQARGRASP